MTRPVVSSWTCVTEAAMSIVCSMVCMALSFHRDVARRPAIRTTIGKPAG